MAQQIRDIRKHRDERLKKVKNWLDDVEKILLKLKDILFLLGLLAVIAVEMVVFLKWLIFH
ncbi:MAG TPA: hypothetical protein VFC63_19360 [Blastocatellia bacterium]|nr:hypothetical protein [Blastocatellia bacterium]